MTVKDYLDGERKKIEAEHQYLDTLKGYIAYYQELATNAGSPVRDQALAAMELTKRRLISHQEYITILEAHVKKIEDEVPLDWMVYG